MTTEALLEAVRAYGDARADVAYGRATRKAIDLAWDQLLAVGGIPPLGLRAAEAPVAAGLSSAIVDTLTVYGIPNADRIARAVVDEFAERRLFPPAAPPSAEGLDVGRLAEALHVINEAAPVAFEDCPQTLDGWHRRSAETIAEEYAALRPSEDTSPSRVGRGAKEPVAVPSRVVRGDSAAAIQAMALLVANATCFRGRFETCGDPFCVEARRKRDDILAALRPSDTRDEPGCVCCEDGFYCRHRCSVHPKSNGLADSGKPWAPNSAPLVDVRQSGVQAAERQVMARFASPAERTLKHSVGSARPSDTRDDGAGT